MTSSYLNAATNGRRTRRVFRKIIHPDMTPMVGLGFLLVTFFLLAANAARPTIMQLTMPSRPEVDDEMASGCFSDGSGGAITIILGRNGQVHYFLGLNDINLPPKVYTTTFAPNGLRQVLLKQRLEDPHVLVLIKPAPGATYRNLVDAIDEMNIVNQHKYALVDFKRADQKLLIGNAL